MEPKARTFSIKKVKSTTADLAQRDSFQVIIDALPTGLIVVDRSGQIIRSNAETDRLFRYGPGELEGTSVELLIPERYRPNHVSLRTAFFDAPTNRKMGAGRDLNGARKDASEFPIEIGLQPLQAEEGPLVFAVIVDISERKRIETALQDANRKLQMKNREMESFIYSVSHDLKSPMVTAMSYLQFIREDLQSGNMPEVMDSLERLERANQRMRQLVSDLLNLSRIGRLELEVSQFDFAELAQEVLKDLADRIQHAGVETNINAEPSATITADRSRIRQILENLINNALKYGSSGASPRIDIELRHEGVVAVLTVRDNGKGIGQDFHRKIFGLFERLETDKEGTGIGLAIVARIAEEHGGKAWVESELGSGAAFHVTIDPTRKREEG